jgi:hypothetical protein
MSSIMVGHFTDAGNVLSDDDVDLPSGQLLE